MRKLWILAVVLAGLAASGWVVISAAAVSAQAPGVRRGEVPPGWVFGLLRGTSEIGVSIRDVARGDVSKMKLPAEAGAVIEDVRRGGPAENAGLRPGDVIIEFDGEKVRSARQLARLVRETPPNRRVRATILRDGSRSDVDVVPTETEGVRVPFNAADVRQSIERALPLPLRRGVLGVTTQEITPELANYFGEKAACSWRAWSVTHRQTKRE